MLHILLTMKELEEILKQVSEFYAYENVPSSVITDEALLRITEMNDQRYEEMAEDMLRMEKELDF